MNLKQDKFFTDESRSNPMVVAMTYPDCPINEVCVYIAVGFGTVMKKCEYFVSEETEDEAECTHLWDESIEGENDENESGNE